jgi:hypothetical protein
MDWNKDYSVPRTIRLREGMEDPMMAMKMVSKKWKIIYLDSLDRSTDNETSTQRSSGGHKSASQKTSSLGNFGLNVTAARL